MNTKFKEPTNKSRSEDFDKVMQFARTSGVVDDNDNHTDLVDLLANCMHWCESHKIDFDSCVWNANLHFNEEQDEESIKTPPDKEHINLSEVRTCEIVGCDDEATIQDDMDNWVCEDCYERILSEEHYSDGCGDEDCPWCP